MIVCISRLLGAGGLTVGEALAADLDAALLDERTIVRTLAERGGFSAEYLSAIDERPPSLATSFIADFARATALVQALEWRTTEQAILDGIRDLVLERAADGNVVLIGHGGTKLLAEHRNTHDIFSLLLVAGRAWRTEQVARRFNIPHEEAAERVRKTDDLRRRFLQHFFATDMYDCRDYDLAIDTERLGLSTAVEIANKAVRALLPTA